jgi:hypothetical protein
MAVLVHPHSWSHQVYWVPPAPVATAAADTVDVLWQPHSGSQTVTVTAGGIVVVEVRAALSVTEALDTVVLNVGAELVLMLMDAELVGATYPAGTFKVNRGEKSVAPLWTRAKA